MPMRTTASQVIPSDDLAGELLESVHTRQHVLGLTHGFYRYPARFSPLFVRAAIRAFTKPGDIVLDPFMGGGTTLVEARVLGRRGIGTDVSGLAVFVARAKTTILSDEDLCATLHWAKGLAETLNLRNPAIRPKEWIERGYQRNISTRKTWAIRKTMELILAQLCQLGSPHQRRFARCVLLRTGQWALDCRTRIPSAGEFRAKFLAHLAEMSEAAKVFSVRAREADRVLRPAPSLRPVCIQRSAVGLEQEPTLQGRPPPRLILTSPPYPGVHALYHRWQVQGRRETPAPFWIANSVDSRDGSFYTCGGRRQKGLTNYFMQIQEAFNSLARVADRETLLVQMVAFSDPSWQLPKYLDVLEQAGFTEALPASLADSCDGRLWRDVPNRKWYAHQKGAIASSREVVLFHGLA